MSAVTARALDEAIAWKLCLDSGEAGDHKHKAFSAWLAASPEHAKVWQQLTDLDNHLAPAAAAPARRALLRRPLAPRHDIGLAGTGLGLVFATVLALLAGQRPLGDYLADETTGTGEQRSLVLQDHSQVRLNSRTAMDIDFDESERRLYLHSGEILVETAHGDTRPFVVDTEQGRLHALGTRFLVRREGEATRLVVLQSVVGAMPAEDREEVRIGAGQQVVMHRDNLDAPQSASPDADAWSRGMLIAENQRLGDLLARLGEYHRGYLDVDSRVESLRISGSFPLHDTDQALTALASSLPIRIERHTDWWIRVVPRT